MPGFEAPIYLSWANANRSALIRVPNIKPGKEKSTRIELRMPDPACNPYLAFACMLMAGLSGIEKGLEPPEPVEDRGKVLVLELEATGPKSARWCPP